MHSGKIYAGREPKPALKATCANPKCEREFPVKHAGARFCSHSCAHKITCQSGTFQNVSQMNGRKRAKAWKEGDNNGNGR